MFQRSGRGTAVRVQDYYAGGKGFHSFSQRHFFSNFFICFIAFPSRSAKVISSLHTVIIYIYIFRVSYLQRVISAMRTTKIQ